MRELSHEKRKLSKRWVIHRIHCNGKVIFLYNDLTPPAKQVVFGFGHFRFSEHEKLQCPQQAKAHTKKGTYQRYVPTCVRGFEPPTFWSVAKRSIQLSYTHIFVSLLFSSATVSIIVWVCKNVNTFLKKI